MMKFIALGLFCIITFLFADDKPLEGFNVIVKDLIIADKTIRISPFKGVGVVTVNLCFKNAGEKQSPRNKEGLVALLAKSMGHSTESKTREQIQAYSREHNVHVSVGSSDDNYTITGKCPPHKLVELFSVIKDILLHSLFHSQDLDRFKNEMIAGTLQAMQSPDTQLGELIKTTALHGHPYGTLQKTYLASLKNIGSADLKLYMKTHFAQENLIVSACGDINEEELTHQVSNILVSLPKSFNAHLPNNTKVTGPYKKYTQTFPVPQTLIHLLHEGIDVHHPDFFALQIAMGCLCSPNIGILWKKVREEKGLTYGIGAGFLMQDHYNSFNISTSTQTEKVEQAITEIKDIIVDICNTGFSADLIDVVKKSFLGNYKRSFASTGHITTRLTNYQLNNRPINFHNILIEKISALTAEEVNEAFRKFIKSDQFMIFTVGQ